MRESKFKRKCAGCNSLKIKDELIKITFVKKTGEIVICPNNKQFGRSVYICKNKECLENAFKKGRFFKILKTQTDKSLKEKIGLYLKTELC